MLYYSTIEPSTLRLLRKIQEIDSLQEFLLVGGTSLALQIGHPISIDLDLFAYTNKSSESILDDIQGLGKIKVANQSSNILNLYIDEIKVDFVCYKYQFLKPPLIRDNLRLASIQDIAAMKLAAITGIGSKKDFLIFIFFYNHSLYLNCLIFIIRNSEMAQLY